ncbi:MAG: MurR/RpiR family transcriptional regulator [Phycisphaerales bacterium]|nr:MurR/RpiR family transcriptional regulator [Phycisphaerales bacterium]
MSIEERIAAVGVRLTPTERRIAQTVLDDPTLLAFGTVSDLANRVGTSRPSIVRFATKLGFDGYTDLQSWIRERVAQKIATPGQRIRRPQEEQIHVGEDIEQAIQQTLATLDQPTLKRLAKPLSGADRIWIISGETSRAGAHALLSGLSMIRNGVHLVDQHNFGRDLSGATKRDAAVVFDFARYRKSCVLAARSLVDLGVSLVAITDTPLSPLASITERWCELRIPAVGPFDSSLPAVLAAELLVLEVAEKLGSSIHPRIDRLERLWKETDTFHDGQE